MPLNKQEIKDVLVNRQVLLDGHFLLTSGKHSQYYFEKFRILQYPQDSQAFCGMIAGHFKD
ncbi:MAG: orotate phosphoribosyltransferase, partial [Deltaproteobacteria bacterium]|nr:orotate phosphoribosyltransferase [Deltaproteobacteria bacterium]